MVPTDGYLRMSVLLLLVSAALSLSQATAFSSAYPRRFFACKSMHHQHGVRFAPSTRIPSLHEPGILGMVPSNNLASAPTRNLLLKTALVLRGGEVSAVSALVDEVIDWCSNLIGPAALVAGAVVGTIYENMNSGDLELLDTDSKRDKLGKKMTRTLLLSAFVLEVVSIFVMVLTMMVLRSRPIDTMVTAAKVTSATTPLSFMRENFEFEYLTIRIFFLQGLFNWLGAIALGFAIPSGESPETRKMNKFVAASVLSMLAFLFSFYNRHLTFYNNYFVMVMHWFRAAWMYFFWQWPPLHMAFVYIPSMILAMYWGWVAFLP